MTNVRRHQRGHLFLKGPSWFLRYYDSKVQPDGTVKRVLCCRKLVENEGVYRSKKAVKALADEFLAPLNNGTRTVSGTISVAEFWTKQYVPYIKSQLKPSTINGYLNMWETYLKDRFVIPQKDKTKRVDLPIRDVETVHIQNILNAVVAEHNLASRTAQHIKHLMGGFFRYALQVGVIKGVNPVHAAGIPKTKKVGDTQAYSLWQILQMLEVLPQPAKALVAVAGFTGLRKGELRCIRPERYDGQSLRVEEAAWRDHIDEPKGKNGVGTIPVVATAAAALDEYLATPTIKNFIFETHDGKPGALDYIARTQIRPALATLGIPWHGLHAFRRGLATNLHELGIQDLVIQQILRHSNVSVTRANYIKSKSANPQSIAALAVLESAVCNQNATGARAAEPSTDVKH